MIETWKTFLTALGAHIDGGRVISFGEYPLAFSGGTDPIICDLSHLSVIQFSGEDNQTFLQAQLTSDIKKLTPELSQYSAYCTPKGRVLANFLLWQANGDYFMQLPSSLSEGVQKRLSMYVLRSKVKLADVSERFVRIGINTHARPLLNKLFHAIPDAPLSVVPHGDTLLISLPGGQMQIVTNIERAQQIWRTVCEAGKAVGTWYWKWLNIQAGIPTITPATQEQFVPQMLNLDVLDALSFKKGCYPGQEIVARTQYRGELKRRMYLAHIDTDTSPQAGDELFSSDLQGQASGMIVNTSPSPGGGADALAVIRIESAKKQTIHWKSIDGPALNFMPLPYQL